VPVCDAFQWTFQYCFLSQPVFFRLWLKQYYREVPGHHKAALFTLVRKAMDAEHLNWNDRRPVLEILVWERYSTYCLLEYSKNLFLKPLWGGGVYSRDFY